MKRCPRHPHQRSIHETETRVCLLEHRLDEVMRTLRATTRLLARRERQLAALRRRLGVGAPVALSPDAPERPTASFPAIRGA